MTAKLSIDISIAQIYKSWDNFRRGKTGLDIKIFEYSLEQNIINLHRDIVDKSYASGEYKTRKVNDPKERLVLVANVRDRLLHRVVYDIVFDHLCKRVDPRVYSGISEKGLYKCLEDIKTESCKSKYKDKYFLRFDIRKYYESINHDILKNILARYFDLKATWLLTKIIDGGSSESVSGMTGDNRSIGVPLGNLTSQIFGLLYLNELDRYLTHTLRIKKWYRYGDDYLILGHEDHSCLIEFLTENLRLEMHKLKVAKVSSGIKFLSTLVKDGRVAISKSSHKKFLLRANFQNYSTYKDIYNKRAGRNMQKDLSSTGYNILSYSYLGGIIYL